jgi:hypothetical protein
MKGLEDEADVGCAQRCPSVFVKLCEVGPVQENSSGSGKIEPGKEGKQGRFAGTGCADDSHGLTPLDTETHIRQDGQSTFRAANLFRDIFRGQYRVFRD